MTNTNMAATPSLNFEVYKRIFRTNLPIILYLVLIVAAALAVIAIEAYSPGAMLPTAGYGVVTEFDGAVALLAEKETIELPLMIMNDEGVFVWSQARMY